MTFVSDLEPRSLWRHFDRILTVPRASKDEGKMRRHVLDAAEASGLEHEVDPAGNVVVRKPATGGHEEAPIVVLQAHLDMVQEKNSDVDFDFSADAIRPQTDGDYLTADGTTLGSDNGIGVAAMLAIAEADDLEHGPLELLFTIDEETGLTGAAALSSDLLRGRRLINLDSEEEGTLCVGCAGGAASTLRLQLAVAGVPGGQASRRLHLSGLKGGHSGVDIHLQRGNAVQLLARILHAARLATPFRVASFGGGSAHNAIPREAEATVVVPEVGAETFDRAVREEAAAVVREYATPEPGIELEAGPCDEPETAWDDATTLTVLRLVTGLPHGVQMMSNDIPGLVETSTNLAIVAPDAGAKLAVGMSSRSSVDSAIHALRRKVRAIGELAGAEVEEGERYPGWKPDMDSELLAVMKRLHEEVLGDEPEVGAIHAGLECGIIGEKYEGMDMISFGPQIEFPHSPDERVLVPSVGRFWKLLTRTLEELA